MEVTSQELFPLIQWGKKDANDIVKNILMNGIIKCSTSILRIASYKNFRITVRLTDIYFDRLNNIIIAIIHGPNLLAVGYGPSEVCVIHHDPQVATSTIPYT